MPSPFPGMNPYLESKALWPEVHHWLITLLAGSLVAELRPKSRVAIEHRVYEMVDGESLMVEIPDVTVARGSAVPQQDSGVATAPTLPQPYKVSIPMPEEVREGYLEVREVATGLVVTAIELLSPKNNHAGAGRSAYEEKRLKVLGSQANFVEIDLLRGGRAMPTVGAGAPERDYRIVVSRARQRPGADLYAFGLQEEIPRFLLPLRAGDAEPVVDLQVLVHRVYEEAGLDLAVDYGEAAPAPKLSAEDLEWSQAFLEGLR